jgi:hypothetical protein
LRQRYSRLHFHNRRCRHDRGLHNGCRLRSDHWRRHYHRRFLCKDRGLDFNRGWGLWCDFDHRRFRACNLNDRDNVRDNDRRNVRDNDRRWLNNHRWRSRLGNSEYNPRLGLCWRGWYRALRSHGGLGGRWCRLRPGRRRSGQARSPPDDGIVEARFDERFLAFTLDRAANAIGVRNINVGHVVSHIHAHGANLGYEILGR